MQCQYSNICPKGFDMYGMGMPCLGAFSLPRVLGVDATAMFCVIPPFGGESGMPVRQKWTVGSIGNAKDLGFKGRTHIVKVSYTTGDTAHLVSIMRPLNFTVTSAAVAANGTVINIADDPGLYSANYKYSSTVPLQVADSGIATNDYIIVQCSDGSWISRKVTVSSLALTVAAIGANVTIDAGALVYQMGLPSDANPADGQVHPSTITTASTVRESLWVESFYGSIPALHDFEPMLFYSPNTVHLGSLESLTGFYSDR